MREAQLAFDLPVREARGREDFFVSPANAAAVARVEAWRDWPGGRLLLIGPEGAGKTHLAHVWAGLAGGRILAGAGLAGADPGKPTTGPLAVEDADRAVADPTAAEALFHLFEATRAARQPVLVTARRPAARWPAMLPDLLSRAQGVEAASLAAPDDALLSAVLVKLFADRQLAVAPRVVEYLTRRMHRSFAAARRLVERLDARAMATGRRITPALAAELLETEESDPA